MKILPLAKIAAAKKRLIERPKAPPRAALEDEMSTLRIQQRKNEPIDLTLMRAFATAIRYMPRRHAVAAVNWMQAYVADPNTATQDEAKP